MKFSNAIICLYGITATVQGAALPDTSSLSIRAALADLIPIPHISNPLEKRKGGGGHGGGGGGKGSGSSSSSSSGSSGAGSSSSSTGGRTSTGSGISPSYGGGRYYGGGATTPYTSGARSPLGISPLFIAAPALAFGGLWAYGAYGYGYAHPYSFHNQSSTNSTNTTLPVQCICAQYSECGCDDNDDDSYLSSLVGNGSASDMNSTLARVTDLNGTRTLVVNGTLPNGTTAAGGTTSASGAGSLRLAELSGWWMMLAVVAATVLSN